MANGSDYFYPDPPPAAKTRENPAQSAADYFFPDSTPTLEETQAMKDRYEQSRYGSDEWYAEKVGSLIPEALEPALRGFQTHVGDYINRARGWLTGKGAAFGREVGEELGTSLTAPMSIRDVDLPSPFGPMGATESPEETAARKFPRLIGASRAIGEFAGGTAADPLTWLTAGGSRIAGPVFQRLLSGAFAAQMSAGTYQDTQTLMNNWDRLSPAERYEAITKTGLGAAFSALAAQHAAFGGAGALPARLQADEAAVEGQVLPPEKLTLPSREQRALPPVIIQGEPARTIIPPRRAMEAPTMEGHEPPVQLMPSPEERPIAVPASSLEQQKLLTGLPETLAPEETAQPKSDLSEVDRSKLPGRIVDPKSIDVDWESHPFMLQDDIDNALERVKKGEEMTAIVRTKPDGRMEVVDGHGSLIAALQANVPIKVTELGNVEGEEAIGVRAASHYLAEDKPEVKAGEGFGDGDIVSEQTKQDVPSLESTHEQLRASTAPITRPSVYGPPKTDFMATYGEVPPESQGFDFRPAEDIGARTRQEVERRMGGPLPRGQAERRAPSPEDIAANEIARLHTSGGSTYNLQQGDLSGKDLYSVGVHPDRTVTLDHPPTPEELKNYMVQNKDLLSRPDRSMGTWDARDGRHVLDVVATVPTEAEAQRLGAAAGQEAIYHLGGRGELPVARQEAPAAVPAAVPAAQEPAGMTHWVFDARTGREKPIQVADIEGYKPKPYEILVRRDASGAEEILAQGKKAFAGAPRQLGLAFEGEKGAATPDFLSYVTSLGIPDIARKVKETISPSSVDGWADVAQFFHEEERAKISERMQRDIVRHFRDLGDPEMIEEAVRAGSVAKGWYDRTAQMFSHLFGRDAKIFTKMFAAVSPMKTVEQNFSDALSLYGDWVAAGRPKGTDRSSVMIVRKLLRGRDLGLAGATARDQLYNILVNGGEPSGPKVSAFARNLMGSMDTVTKDRWVAFLFGKDAKFFSRPVSKATGLQPAKAMAVDAAMRAVARKMDMLPAEAQESAWSFLRAVVNFSEERKVAPSEAARQITESDIKAGAAEFARLISSDPKIRAQLDELADRTGNRRFRVSSIESSPKYQQLLAEHAEARGGLEGARREVLGSVAERAAAARSGGELIGKEEGDVSFAPERATPISDALIKQYGTTDSPLGAQFVLPDGRRVAIGIDHDLAIQRVMGKEGGGPTQRENFINDEGAVRTRFRTSRIGKEVVFSVPEKVTSEQIEQMKGSVKAMGAYGNLSIERAEKGGQYFTKENPSPDDVDIGLKKIGAHPEGGPALPWSSELMKFHETGAHPEEAPQAAGALTSRLRRDRERGAVTPAALLNLRNLPGDFWKNFIADPILQKVGMGPKYKAVSDVDPRIAGLLKLRDNVISSSRQFAKKNVDYILQGLDRSKERLAFLMSDAESRANLQRNHPAEYRQAANDPQVMGAVNRYRQFEQELTNERQAAGFGTLPGDYIKRVYETHIAEPGSTRPFSSTVQLRDLDRQSRFADPEYHYENGLHEFGPAYATKFVSQKAVTLDRAIIGELSRRGTVIGRDDPRPDSIQYQGKTYYSPEQAKLVGSRDVYNIFDPTKFAKFKVSDNLILAPKKVVDALAGSGDWGKVEPAGKFAQFYRKGVVGLGFGIPHAFANVPRRIMNSFEGGALNPAAWKSTFKVLFDKELRSRSESFYDPSRPLDPTLKKLIANGAARLEDEYGGLGSKFLGLKMGHDLIFKPGSWDGLGGVDVRARMEYADRLINQNPRTPFSKIAEQVENRYGKYNKANWTEAQKTYGKVAAFPGWLFSSIRTGLEHPLRATVPAAVLVYSLNQALNKAGMNRDEDAKDISRIHVGDYAVSPTVFSEPFAKAVTLAPMQAAQPMIRGDSSREAAADFMKGLAASPGRLLYHMLPYYTTPFEIAFNRQFAGSEREIWRPGAFDRKGATGLSEGTEAILRHLGTQNIPQVGRLFPESEGGRTDIPSFLGSQVGLPMTHQEAEDRLHKNLAITGRAALLTSDMSKTDPKEIREILNSEPRTRTELGFHPAFIQLQKALGEIDREEKAASDPATRRNLENARAYILKTADEINERFNAQLKESRTSVKLKGE